MGRFSTIYNNVNKLENIIQDFLSISKMESSNILNIQEVSVEKIYSDLKISLSSIIDKKNGIIVFEKSNDLDNVMEIDYDKLQMIIKNLVENGFIYNSDKNPKVIVSINQNSKNYILKVSDNGIGIDKEKQDRIFERFYRIEEARTTNLAGTGLGLAIVQELVKKMHGSIEIQSNLGVGTIFTIEIPKN